MTADQTTTNTPHTHTECMQLHCGNNVDVLRSYPDCHFDVIITDPFYGIEFLGKDWDHHTGAVELGHTFVGIDLDAAYVRIARKRIEGWVKPKDHTIKTATDSEPTDLWDDLFE